MRSWRQERRIRLNQETFGRHNRRGRPQVIGILEREDTGERAVPTAFTCCPCEVRVTAKAMQNHRLGVTFIVKNPQDVVVGVAIVNHQRLTEPFGEPNMKPKGLLLDRTPGKFGSEEVHSRLADRAHLREFGELADLAPRSLKQCQSARLVDLWRLVGMQRNSGPDVVVFRRHLCCPSRTLNIAPDLDHLRHPNSRCCRQRLVDCGAPLGGTHVEVTVAVHDRRS